jgi:hypothetical protein
MEGPPPGYQRISKDPYDWVCFSSPQLLSYSVLLVGFAGGKQRRAWSTLAPSLYLTSSSLSTRPSYHQAKESACCMATT